MKSRYPYSRPPDTVCAAHAANRQGAVFADQEGRLVEERRASEGPPLDNESQGRADVGLGKAELTHQLGIQDVAAIPGDARASPQRAIEPAHELGNGLIAAFR